MLAPTPAHAGPFALGTFSTGGQPPFAGLVVGDQVRDLGDLAGGAAGASTLTVRRLVEDWDAVLPKLHELAASKAGSWRPLCDLSVLPPLQPGQVLQSGANFRQHVIDIVMAEAAIEDLRSQEEARAEAEAMMDARAAWGRPYIFIGLASAICGAFDDIVLHTRGVQHDWELELAVVIGRAARYVSPAGAIQYVAGYTICNDITTRDQVYRPDLKAIGTDWLAAKNAPTFLPTGPFLVPAGFVDDPMDLRMVLRHNGRARQDESTKDMIFDIAHLVSYTSQMIELRPGDLLLTGSPAGNGAYWNTFLAHGDVIEAEITGLGLQRNVCVDEVRLQDPLEAPYAGW